MKAATIAELKRTLVTLDQGELLEAVLRLARFKKDNKELLTYLLYLSKNEASYVKKPKSKFGFIFAVPCWPVTRHFTSTL